MSAVVVVGSGVVGLSCAHELALAGHRVRVLADTDPLGGVSAVAGGLWFPYRARPLERVVPWGLVTRDRLTTLAADPATGVHLVEGLMVDRVGEERPWWAEGLPDVRPARPDELPDGVPAGHVCTVPVVTMTRYLPWLAGRCRSLGVAVEQGRVERVGDLAADVVVVAAGLRSGRLTEDADLLPVRGQVVRVRNPGLRRWVVDGERPDGTAYVLPHGDQVVCGGTAEEGEWGEEPDPEVERGILARCAALEPRLAGAEVVSRAVGLRPGAPAVRLDRREVDGREVVTCYGHGGAGVTLSWGCAVEVVGLVGAGTYPRG